MAFLQPQNIPSRSDVPARLQNVAKCLREFLPDDVTVWLERTDDGERDALRKEFEQQRFEGLGEAAENSEAYLVVLDPAAGIAILEAPSRLPVRKSSGRASKIDRSRIRDSTAQRASELRSGLDARSVVGLPVVVAQALPGMSASNADAMLSDIPVLCADDFTPEALRPALHEIIGGRRRPLRARARNAARAAVNPAS